MRGPPWTVVDKRHRFVCTLARPSPNQFPSPYPSGKVRMPVLERPALLPFDAETVSQVVHEFELRIEHLRLPDSDMRHYEDLPYYQVDRSPLVDRGLARASQTFTPPQQRFILRELDTISPFAAEQMAARMGWVKEEDYT